MFYILCSTIGSKSHSEFATESNCRHPSTLFRFKPNPYSIFETTSSSIDFESKALKSILDSQSLSTHHPTRQLRPRSHLCAPWNVSTILGAHVPLGHSSNQVLQNLTHMWHLWTPLISTHRLSESFSLIFGVTYLMLRNVSNNLLSTFTHISWRNLYLDSIIRLLPTVKVSIYQEYILRLAPWWLSQRRVKPPSSFLIVLGQPVRHRKVFLFFPEEIHGIMHHNGEYSTFQSAYNSLS